MQLDVTYKLADTQDLPALIAVGDKLFDYPVKPESAEEFLGDDRHHLIVAYLQNKVIGMASGLHYVHPDKHPELFINEVSVLDEYQNKGIGRKLVQHLCEHGKTLGCKQAWVGTEVSNHKARKTYAAAGGKEDKEPFILIEFRLD